MSEDQQDGVGLRYASLSKSKIMAARLGLGTVQWGTAYGISNLAGITSEGEVARILAAAGSHGVNLLDTAVAYGQAEAVLGRNDLGCFRIVTKTPVFKSEKIVEDHAQALTDSLLSSLRTLAVPRLYGLLVHHADDLLAPGGWRLVATLQALKTQGLVDKIGVSIYRDDQLEQLLNFFIPDVVQLPLNVFDQRLILNGRLAQLKAMGVEIHVRSAFLQGLLLMEPTLVPAYFSPIAPLFQAWHGRVKEHHMSPVQAALAFVRDQSSVDVVLVGVSSVNEFSECLEQFSRPGSFDASGLECSDSAFTNPSQWKLK